MIIANNHTRMNQLSDLRILYIKTLEVRYPIGNRNFPEHLTFELTFNNLYRLKNTISLSTRFMWNVYAQMRVEEYFEFEPFVWIFSKYLMESRQFEMSNKDIEYFFLYR